MKNVPEKEVITLTVVELARLLGVSTSTVYTMVRNNEIPFFKMRGKILFNRGLVEAWTRGELYQA